MADEDEAPRVAPGRRLWLSWLFGLSLVATVVLVASQRAEEKTIAHILERARPSWLLVAILLQAGTYAAEAGVWKSLVATTGRREGLSSFIGLAFAKLFIDQAVPSGGWSGTLVIVHALERRGIPRGIAMAGVIVDLAGYYVAYLVALTGALIIFATLGLMLPEIVVPVLLFSLFAGVMISVPSLLVQGKLIGRLGRLRPLRRLVDIAVQSDPALLRTRRLWSACVGCELAIFLLDGATLWSGLRALGFEAPILPTFAAYMVAALARTIGILPGGLGTFEGVSVASLRLCGVPLGAALAGTLLFRGLSFWIPLLPGLVFARRVSRG